MKVWKNRNINQKLITIPKDCDINEGDLLTDANVALRRPGNGLPPQMLDKIIGLRATCRISKGRLLQLDDFN